MASTLFDMIVQEIDRLPTPGDRPGFIGFVERLGLEPPLAVPPPPAYGTDALLTEPWRRWMLSLFAVRDTCPIHAIIAGHIQADRILKVALKTIPTEWTILRGVVSALADSLRRGQFVPIEDTAQVLDLVIDCAEADGDEAAADEIRKLLATPPDNTAGM